MAGWPPSPCAAGTWPARTWTLTGSTLTGPAGREVPLPQIEAVKTLGSYVQVITKSGGKHLIKYQADPAATLNAIERAKA